MQGRSGMGNCNLLSSNNGQVPLLYIICETTHVEMDNFNISIKINFTDVIIRISWKCGIQIQNK